MKKVLVTGANGFLGSNLCKKLIELDFQVSVLVRKNSDVSELTDLPVNYFYGDIANFNSLLEATKGIHTVFHLAGLISYKKYDREKMNLINVQGTKNVVEACLKNGVEKLLHLSSVVTIGASFSNQILDESSSFDIHDLNLGYFETKKQAEDIVIHAAKNSGLFAVCVNPSTIYGEADAKKGSRSNQVKVAQGRMPFYTSGGVNVVSVHDVIEGILLALEKGKSGERYILANENITIKNLFQIIAKKAGKPAPKVYMPSFILHLLGFLGDLFKKGLSSENAYTASMYHWFSFKKATNELGYHPKVKAEKAIEDSVQWMKKNGLLE